MARIRTVKPEFWTSEQIAECSPNARLLFIGMWNFCDDSGVHPANAMRLKMEVFPADTFTRQELSAMVQELCDAKLLSIYSVEGEEYWRVTGWKHQKIDRPGYKYPLEDGKIPESAIVRRDVSNRSSSTRRLVVEHSPPEGKVREGKGRDKETPQRASRLPDDFSVTDEHRTFARQHGLPEPDSLIGAFRDHFKGKPGKDGTKLDWNATFRNWMRNALRYGSKQPSGTAEWRPANKLPASVYREGL